MEYDENFLIQIKREVQKKLSSERYFHTQRVVETALKLSEKRNINKKIKIAAWLHDFAKNQNYKTTKKLALKSGWKIDKLELSIPSVLHAPAGAYLARKKFGINNFEILKAIRFHTIGSPNMGKLALIIFASDIIEPGRDFPGLDRLRKTIKSDFKAGIVSLCERSIKYNFNEKKIVHPNTLLLRNFLLEGEDK